MIDFAMPNDQNLEIQHEGAAGENASSSEQTSSAGAEAASTSKVSTGAEIKTEEGQLGRKVQEEQKSGAQGSMLEGLFLPILMIGFLFVFFFLTSRSRKKQQQKHENLVSNLKRDDKVMLQNGKFVFIEKVEKDKVFVFGDVARTIREEYHRNAVVMKASDVTKDSASQPGT